MHSQGIPRSPCAEWCWLNNLCSTEPLICSTWESWETTGSLPQRIASMNKTQGRLLSDLSPSQLFRHSKLNSNENKTWFALASNQPSRTAWPRGVQLPAYWNPLLPFLTQTWWTSFASDHRRMCCNCWVEPVGEEISSILGIKWTKKPTSKRSLK